MAFGTKATEMVESQAIIVKKYTDWVENIPEFYETQALFMQLAEYKKLARQLRKEIKQKEDQVITEQDKPRSNEAKIAKIEATKELTDQLADIEAELEKLEVLARFVEIQKTMFQQSSYQITAMYRMP